MDYNCCLQHSGYMTSIKNVKTVNLGCIEATFIIKPDIWVTKTRDGLKKSEHS
jgi:hypothetical protein